MANKILVIDDTKVDLTEKKSSQANDATQYMTPAQIVESSGAVSGYTYSEVNINSTAIKGLGLSGGEVIVANQGAGTYLEYFGIVEYTHVSTPYTVFSGDTLQIASENTLSGCILDPDILTASESSACFFSNLPSTAVDPTNEDNIYIKKTSLNESLLLKMLLDVDPTLGDGTILVKIWYKVKTFGTEL